MDTESDRYTKEIALIQFHSIPATLPAVVLLIELNHLPAFNTELFKKIYLLFQSIFRSGNSLYSWGPPIQEMKKALVSCLFSFPLACECANLQDKFKGWIEGNPPPCESCSSENINLRDRCQCIFLPHVGTNEVWSLQNAIRFSCRQFLDKSFTKYERSLILDPVYSRISPSELENLIRYATYDCLAVTYLRRPVMNDWKFQEFKEATLHMLITDPSSNKINYELEDVSDDEIVSPTIINNNIIRLSTIVHDTKQIPAMWTSFV